MANWEGFTEADLRKLQGNNSEKRPKIVKPVTKKRTTANAASNRGKQMPSNKAPVCVRKSNEDVPSAALLSKPKPTRSKSASEEKVRHEPELKVTTPPAMAVTINEESILLDDESIHKKEKLKLEEVRQRQKQMEEKNRRKKAMLTKEIAERKKRAFAESSKLVKIQAELTKLDQLLNIDVSVLRDKIDDACLEFSYAQKRFEKAEAEYVEAKTNLHHKTILKEDLTDHLFNLIQANEERKAKKLEELMLKLDVEEDELEAREAQRKEQEEKRKASEAEKVVEEHRETEKINSEGVSQTTNALPSENKPTSNVNEKSDLKMANAGDAKPAASQQLQPGSNEENLHGEISQP